MSFIVRTNVLLRTLILALFLISMRGPWMFDLINVPAQYACGTPFVRLHGDFCGYPLSGLETIKWFGSGVFPIIGELIKGNFASRIPELIMLICILIVVVPFFSSLLLIRNQNSRRLQTINLIAWGLAGLLTSAMFILQIPRDQFIQFFYLLWGLGLYIFLAIGTIIFEVLVLKSTISPGMYMSSNHQAQKRQV